MITPTIRNAEGCVFRQRFINDAYITDNNGTINGTSNFDSGFGVFRNDWSISYPYSKTFPVIRSGVFSIHLQGLISDIDTHEGAVFGWRADVNNRFYIEFPRTTNKQARIVYNVNGGGVVSVTTPVNSLNNGYYDIVFTFNGATWQCFINQILVTLTGVTIDFAGLQGAGQIVVGSYQPATNSAWINLKCAELFNRVLTPGEINDEVFGVTFKEVDVRQLEFFLPLRTHYNNGTAELTQNVGVVGDDTIKWGDGNTASTYPTLIKNNGASFDGGDYIYISSLVNINNLFPFSFGCLFNTTVQTAMILMDVRDSSVKGFGVYLNAGNLTAYTDAAGVGQFLSTTGKYADGTWHSLIVNMSPAAGSTLIDIYVDGVVRATGLKTAFTSTTARPVVGAEYDFGGGVGYNGKMKFPFLWRFDLTPTQVKWQHEVLMRQINL
jgi:hypothetical protein